MPLSRIVPKRRKSVVLFKQANRVIPNPEGFEQFEFEAASGTVNAELETITGTEPYQVNGPAA